MNEIQNQPVTVPDGKKQQPWVWVAVGCGCLALVLLALLLGGVAYYFLRGEQWPPAPPTVMPESLPRPIVEGNTMGDPNAPVTIIEYADFQCPYCRIFLEETEAKIIETYVKTGKVYFVYRSAGNFIGPESAAAAEAAYCAGDQGKFWEYHDILYANQTGENVGAYSERNLLRFADALGFNVDPFKECLKSGKYTERVNQDAADMQKDGVQATPSFLINGRLVVEGAEPFEVFQKAIEAALQGN